MSPAALLLALVLAQGSEPYLRSRVDQSNTSSQCLFWTVPTLRWHLSRLGNPKSSEAQKQNEFTALRRSFQTWQDAMSACGNLRFEEGPLVEERTVGYKLDGENRNIVLFRGKRCSDVVPADDACWPEDTCGNAYDCWDENGTTIAITLTTYDVKSGIVYDSDIQFNAAGFDFTTADGPPCGSVVGSSCVATDVQNTMTHEIGHMLGLDHVSVRTSTMYPQAPPGEVSKRTLDSGSRNFVCEAYPKGLPSQSCFTPTLDREAAPLLGRHAMGCSSAGAQAWLPALAGWGAWLLRRRRRGGV